MLLVASELQSFLEVRFGAASIPQHSLHASAIDIRLPKLRIDANDSIENRVAPASDSRFGERFRLVR